MFKNKRIENYVNNSSNVWDENSDSMRIGFKSIKIIDDKDNEVAELPGYFKIVYFKDGTIMIKGNSDISLVSIPLLNGNKYTFKAEHRSDKSDDDITIIKGLLKGTEISQNSDDMVMITFLIEGKKLGKNSD